MLRHLTILLLSSLALACAAPADLPSPNSEKTDETSDSACESDEPILACSNDPDDVKKLSEVAGRTVDEVFIGSCMTNIGHFRAAARVLEGRHLGTNRLWIATPTRMDKEQLESEGVMATLAAAGARIEIPGCSLCMGNQARVEDDATVFSTSTRNFDNRMGTAAKVYLGSAELGAVVALQGKLPTPAEYFEVFEAKVQPAAAEVYTYLQFDELS